MLLTAVGVPYRLPSHQNQTTQNKNSTSSWCARPRPSSSSPCGSSTAAAPTRTTTACSTSAAPPSGEFSSALFLLYLLSPGYMKSIHPFLSIPPPASQPSLSVPSHPLPHPPPFLYMSLQKSSVSTDGVIVRKVVGAANGRIFLAGQDGNVYEVNGQHGLICMNVWMDMDTDRCVLYIEVGSCSWHEFDMDGCMHACKYVCMHACKYVYAGHETEPPCPPPTTNPPPGVLRTRGRVVCAGACVRSGPLTTMNDPIPPLPR